MILIDEILLFTEIYIHFARASLFDLQKRLDRHWPFIRCGPMSVTKNSLVCTTGLYNV